MSNLGRAVLRGAGGDETRLSMFRWIVRSTAGIALALLAVVLVVEPDAAARVAIAASTVTGLAIAAELLARSGRLMAGGLTFVLGLCALILGGAYARDNVNSPGTRGLLVIVLIAGVLLGERAAYAVATLVTLATLGLALLAESGALTAPQPDRPIMVWLLNSIYLGLALLVMRLFARSVAAALDESRRVAQEREVALRRLDQVLAASRVGIWEFDPASRTYSANQRLFDVLASDADPTRPVPEQQWLQLVHPDDVGTLVRNRDAASAAGTVSQQLVRVRTMDGRWRYLDVTFAPDPSGSGSPRRAIGLVLDRTTQYAAERERAAAAATLNERVKELTALHEIAQLLRIDRPFSAAVLDDLVRVLPRAFQWPEHTVARVVAGTLASPEADETPAALRLVTPLASRTAPGEIVVALTREPPDGHEPFLVEERQLVATVAEMLEGYIERDAARAERSRIERQLRQASKMEALGTMAGGIAHDFNNVLSAIGTNASLAAAEVPPGSVAAQALAEIDRVYGRARALVRRLLLIGKKEVSERQAVDVRETLDEVRLIVRGSVQGDIKLHVDVPADLPPVHADPTQVHQVLLNLAVNAVQAMRNSGGELRITATTLELAAATADYGAPLAPGRYVRVDVRDSGTGIDPVLMDRLFDPYFSTKGSEGTGLGLAVVYRVMQENGGAVRVESQLGIGTTFSVCFPVFAGEVSARANSQAVSRGRGERILLVDDEPAIAFALSRLLQASGYPCVSFTDPLEALQAFRSESGRFDLAIVDMSMPGMTGVELARALKVLRPHIPVVLCSGYSGEQFAPDSLSEIAATVAKPVNLPDLTRVLTALLRPS